jgi:hypothetical protein
VNWWGWKASYSKDSPSAKVPGSLKLDIYFFLKLSYFFPIFPQLQRRDYKICLISFLYFEIKPEFQCRPEGYEIVIKSP